MSSRIRSDAQKFTHDNYSAAVSPATKTLPASASSFFIQNMDGTASVLFSLDGGANYKTVVPGASISIDVDGLQSYLVKSSSGTPAVECLYASEA